MTELVVGDRYGHWTIIESGLKRGTGHASTSVSLCRCDCGTTKIIRNVDLKNGHTKSCGCCRGEAVKNSVNGKAHGFSKTRLYGIWTLMNWRCDSANSPFYDRYGGRGINVCPEWKNDFLAFREWALSNGYSDDLSIDRINNDKGYYPENCRWATREEQQNNLRWNINLTMNGKTQSARKWARELGIPYNTLYTRIKYGWDDIKALTYPIDKRKSSTQRRKVRA